MLAVCCYAGCMDIKINNEVPDAFGILNVRVPADLKVQLRKAAHRHGVSLTSLTVQLLQQALVELKKPRATRQSTELPEE